MTGPQVSIIISPGSAAQRLGLGLRTAIASGERSGLPFEVVIGLADADGPTREVAEAQRHPRIRLSASSVANTEAAAELAWGETVVLLKGGDMVSPDYVGRLAAAAHDLQVIARPIACVTYGGAPSVRRQSDLTETAIDRARLVFAAPFAPPFAAGRSTLLRSPPRLWSLEHDWTWTRQTLAAGLSHMTVEGAVHVAWTPPSVVPLGLPAITRAEPLSTMAPAGRDASDAEVAAVLYARAALSRLDSAEAALRLSDDKLAGLDRTAQDLAGALASAHAEAQRAQADADALRASSSWKLTAPLRAVMSSMKPRLAR